MVIRKRGCLLQGYLGNKLRCVQLWWWLLLQVGSRKIPWRASCAICALSVTVVPKIALTTVLQRWCATAAWQPPASRGTCVLSEHGRNGYRGRKSSFVFLTDVQTRALGIKSFYQIVLRNCHLMFVPLKHLFPLALLLFISPARGLRTFVLVLLQWMKVMEEGVRF